MNVHSHYENLKVSRDAPMEVIRAAYKALSMLWHPDRSTDPRAAEIMKTINIAYETLSNPVTRREHDEWLASKESAWKSEPNATDFKPAQPNKRGRAFDIDEDRLKEGLKRADERRLRTMREHLICLVFRSFRMRHFG